MSRCYCRVVLSILVIVFAWLTFSWAKIVTVLGVILAIQALAGTCCCAVRREDKAASESPATE